MLAARRLRLCLSVAILLGCLNAMAEDTDATVDDQRQTESDTDDITLKTASAGRDLQSEEAAAPPPDKEENTETKSAGGMAEDNDSINGETSSSTGEQTGDNMYDYYYDYDYFVPTLHETAGSSNGRRKRRDALSEFVDDESNNKPEDKNGDNCSKNTESNSDESEDDIDENDRKKRSTSENLSVYDKKQQRLHEKLQKFISSSNERQKRETEPETSNYELGRQRLLSDLEEFLKSAKKEDSENSRRKRDSSQLPKFELDRIRLNERLQKLRTSSIVNKNPLLRGTQSTSSLVSSNSGQMLGQTGSLILAPSSGEISASRPNRLLTHRRRLVLAPSLGKFVASKNTPFIPKRGGLLIAPSTNRLGTAIRPAQATRGDTQLVSTIRKLSTPGFKPLLNTGRQRFVVVGSRPATSSQNRKFIIRRPRPLGKLQIVGLHRESVPQIPAGLLQESEVSQPQSTTVMRPLFLLSGSNSERKPSLQLNEYRPSQQKLRQISQTSRKPGAFTSSNYISVQPKREDYFRRQLLMRMLLKKMRLQEDVRPSRNQISSFITEQKEVPVQREQPSYQTLATYLHYLLGNRKIIEEDSGATSQQEELLHILKRLLTRVEELQETSANNDWVTLMERMRDQNTKPEFVTTFLENLGFQDQRQLELSNRIEKLGELLKEEECIDKSLWNKIVLNEF